MLKDRLQSGIFMGALVLAAFFWLSPVGVLLVLLVLCSLAMWEFYRLLDASGVAHFKYVGLAGGLALISATWWSLHAPHGRPIDTDWLVLFAIVMAVFLRQFPQKNNPRPLVTIAGTLMGVMYVPFLFNFLTKLLMLWGFRQSGRWIVLFLILVTKLTDVGAFFVGCGIGRHKLIPRISPAKTWEGFAGGVLTGVVTSVLFCWIGGGRLGVLTMSMPDAVALGFLLSVTGTVGDLTESLFKRAAGIKDSGRIVHGMGGVLDVLDSLLFAAPALYAYARFFMK